MPKAPEAIKGDTSLGLTANADALVAYDAALTADKAGEQNPAAARDAWVRVTQVKEGNPYLEIAAQRRDQWADFLDKAQRAAKQKQADTEKLRKILPLGSISAEQKQALLDQYKAAYGAEPTVMLLDSVQPLELRQTLCKPALTAGIGISVSVQPMRANGATAKSRILVDGQVIGEAPGTFKLPPCA